MLVANANTSIIRKEYMMKWKNIFKWKDAYDKLSSAAGKPDRFSIWLSVYNLDTQKVEKETGCGSSGYCQRFLASKLENGNVTVLEFHMMKG